MQDNGRKQQTQQSQQWIFLSPSPAIIARQYDELSQDEDHFFLSLRFPFIYLISLYDESEGEEKWAAAAEVEMKNVSLDFHQRECGSMY